MPKNFDHMENSNFSNNTNIHEVFAERHTLLKAALAMPMLSFTAFALSPIPRQNLLGFKGIVASAADSIRVPEGYVAHSLAPWGEAVGILGNMPAFKEDASNTALEQAAQMGMHHDGMHFYPLAKNRGLLAMNHEYVDDGLLHPSGMSPWTADKVAKSQAAHGLSVIEIEQVGDKWNMVRPSSYARRITANTPFRAAGPAAGHALMKTAADPEGKTILGTFNNCASGITPWGTYLSGEENFRFYFTKQGEVTAHEKRWGVLKTSPFGWAQHDPRFDIDKNPNEFNRAGWIVELDPYDPTSTPVKRTAMGRAAHEGATVALTKDKRAVVYSGEDARFEYIYKFVSRDAMREGGAKANADLLDHGTLYVARFDADGSGRWLPLTHGKNGLNAEYGFSDQGEVVIKARQASDLLGGTKMDRPEWLAVDEKNRTVFCALTNNTARGSKDQPGVDAANPRAQNNMGAVIRWQEQGDLDAQSFTWDHLVLAGDPANARAEAKGNIKGDLFGCPDGLCFDQRGVLWIQTDAFASELNKGEFVNMGNNQMLACDPATGEVRRFLTGPVNCEITGATFSPDGCTMFINVQHPGETPSERSDPKAPDRFSTWPSGEKGKRPRSATVVIRKLDGGLIGT